MEASLAMATALSLLTIYQHTKGVRGQSPLKLKALQAFEIYGSSGINLLQLDEHYRAMPG